MIVERINIEPELLFNGDYLFIKNSSPLSYDGDTTFLYITYNNYYFNHSIFVVLCSLGFLFSYLGWLLDNKHTVYMLYVYIILSIYILIPSYILFVLKKAVPLISYEAAFLTFQFNIESLFIITLSYFLIILFTYIYLSKVTKTKSK